MNVAQKKPSNCSLFFIDIVVLIFNLPSKDQIGDYKYVVFCLAFKESWESQPKLKLIVPPVVILNAMTLNIQIPKSLFGVLLLQNSSLNCPHSLFQFNS